MRSSDAPRVMPAFLRVLACEHYGMNRSLYQTEMRYIDIALIESQQNKT